MTRRTAALGIGAVFFLFWMAFFYAIADHPVPSGFYQIVILTLGCAVVVGLRVPSYLDWKAARRRGRFFLAVRDGLAAGLVVAGLVVVVNVLGISGSPTAPGAMVGLAIFLTVLGAINAAAVYGVASVVARWVKG